LLVREIGWPRRNAGFRELKKFVASINEPLTEGLHGAERGLQVRRRRAQGSTQIVMRQIVAYVDQVVEIRPKRL
jgi:hypothetical protein